MRLFNKERLIVGLSTIVCLGVITGCSLEMGDVEKIKEGKSQVENKYYIESLNGAISDYSNKDIMLEPLEEDNQSIVELYKLPSLERMSQEDSEECINNLQVISKIRNLGYDVNEALYPEKNWKQAYNSVLSKNNEVTFKEEVTFEGDTTSELNNFIKNNQNKIINIKKKEVILDESIIAIDNIYLKGQGTKLINSDTTRVEKAICINSNNNVIIEGMIINGGTDYGIYITSAENIICINNKIQQVEKKPLVVMGENNYVTILGNEITDNAHGGIYFDGKIQNSIIEDNVIMNNKGTSNWMAGIVLTNLPITNIEDPYDNFREDLHFPTEYKLETLLDCPSQIIVRNNIVENNNASGIYSDGAYSSYIIDNRIVNNDKEGICLDYGTFGTYVSKNYIAYNGRRMNQTDQDLQNDFVLQHGRMEDGSAKAKLPGISIDNAAYNVVLDNHIQKNYGSGVKMVRTGIRNIIMKNNIDTNNVGQNENFHFFGIELGNAVADVEAENLDFTPAYENIIARNTVTGSHYAGIFLAEECYINDIFDNIIMDAKMFSMESLTDKLNSSFNNLGDMPSRGIMLSNSTPTISLPEMVQ